MKYQKCYFEFQMDISELALESHVVLIAILKCNIMRNTYVCNKNINISQHYIKCLIHILLEISWKYKQCQIKTQCFSIRADQRHRDLHRLLILIKLKKCVCQKSDFLKNSSIDSYLLLPQTLDNGIQHENDNGAEYRYTMSFMLWATV